MNTTGFSSPAIQSGCGLPEANNVTTLHRMYCLFVDLDGVLADFDSGVKEATGLLPSEQSPRSMWPRLARVTGFYEHLGWLPPGRGLWSEIKGLSPTILTGLPLGKWAEPQKRAWCGRELGEGIPVITCMSREKGARARAATPDGATPVLIDDRDSLRERFEEVGGVFIHCADHARALSDLRSLDGDFVPTAI